MSDGLEYAKDAAVQVVLAVTQAEPVKPIEVTYAITDTNLSLASKYAKSHADFVGMVFVSRLWGKGGWAYVRNGRAALKRSCMGVCEICGEIILKPVAEYKIVGGKHYLACSDCFSKRVDVVEKHTDRELPVVKMYCGGDSVSVEERKPKRDVISITSAFDADKRAIRQAAAV